MEIAMTIVHRRPLALLTLLAMLLAAVLAVAQWSAPEDSPLRPTTASALGKVKCDHGKDGQELPSGSNVTIVRDDVDPIVNHNQPASSHVHDFFGAGWLKNVAGQPTWPVHLGNTAMESDLRATITSCRVAADTAGYWVPTLRYISGPKIGQGVPVQQFTAYYRGYNGQTTHSTTEPLPANVRLVAQDMIGKGLSGWTCGQNSTVTGGQNSIPDCSGEDGSPGNTLTAHVNFPSCWDGVAPSHSSSEVGDTRDNAHFAYPSGSGVCPTGFPRKVTQLRETIQYQYTGNGTDVALDGQPAGEDGTTYHADFMNSWDTAVFAGFIRKCVNGLSATTYTGSCDP